MDVRGQRTTQAIAASFLELLEEKPISQITVTQICQSAHINRATFYKHYLDVYHLQEALESNILQDLETFLKDHGFSEPGNYEAMVTELLSYAKHYGHTFDILCSSSAASDFPSRVFSLLYSLTFPILKEKFPNLCEDQANLLYQYISSGSGSILRSYLAGKCSMEDRELAKFIMLISSSAIAAVAERG